MKKIAYFVLILICLFFSLKAFATDYGIVISGGDAKADVSNWREETADKFTELIKGRGVESGNIEEPRSEDGVKNAILGLKGKVKCGDNVVIYFNGHGNSSGGLCIARRHNNRIVKETISPDEMLKWLRDDELPCCVQRR